MRTKKFELFPSQKDPSMGNLRLKITENRIPSTISLKEQIPVKDWDMKNQKVKRSNKEHQRINEKIDDYVKTYFYEEYTPPVKSSFIEYFQKTNNLVLNTGTRMCKNSKLNVLKKYLQSIGKSDLKYNELDHSFVLGFQNYLSKNVGKNHTIRTIRELKGIYNKLVNVEGVSFKRNPFVGLDKTEVYVNNKGLDLEEINIIIETPITPTDNRTKKLHDHRNFFLFQIYSMGMRVRDLHLLRWNQIKRERIEYTTNKNDKRIEYLILQNLLNIIVEYSPFYNPEHRYSFQYKDGIYYEYDKVKMKNKTIPFDEDSLDFSLCDFEYIENPETFRGYPSLIGFRFDIRELEQMIHEVQGTLYVSQKNSDNEKTEKCFKNIESLVILKNNILFDILHRTSLDPKYKDNFVFPLLDNDYFKNINGKNNWKNITEEQYKKINSRCNIYNDNLERLQSHYQIETKITSHISRHTFTQLMISRGVEWYIIYKCLGHTNFNTTRVYLNSLDKTSIDTGVKEIDNVLNRTPKEGRFHDYKKYIDWNKIKSSSSPENDIFPDLPF
jgi:site-specific recombinase XerD